VTARGQLEPRLVEIPGVGRCRSRGGRGEAYCVVGREVVRFYGHERLDVRGTREVIRRPRPSRRWTNACEREGCPPSG